LRKQRLATNAIRERTESIFSSKTYRKQQPTSCSRITYFLVQLKIKISIKQSWLYWAMRVDTID